MHRKIYLRWIISILLLIAIGNLKNRFYIHPTTNPPTSLMTLDLTVLNKHNLFWSHYIKNSVKRHRTKNVWIWDHCTLLLINVALCVSRKISIVFVTAPRSIGKIHRGEKSEILVFCKYFPMSLLNLILNFAILHV
jgi:hypothetical protein